MIQLILGLTGTSFIMMIKNRFFSKLLACALVCLFSSMPGFAQDALDKQLEELENMMQKSGIAMPAFHNLKLVAKEKGPFPGMDALVYDAMVGV